MTTGLQTSRFSEEPLLRKSRGCTVAAHELAHLHFQHWGRRLSTTLNATTGKGVP